MLSEEDPVNYNNSSEHIIGTCCEQEMFFTILLGMSLLLIYLAVSGRTLGFRSLYVNCLIRAFEWGSTFCAPLGHEEEEFEEESVSENGTSHIKHRRSSSSSDLGIIEKEKMTRIDAKLHSTAEPTSKKTTVSVLVDDTLDFITAGIETIIEDDVTNRFTAEQLPTWNFLSRTKYSFHWRVTILWFAGFLLRYLVLVPFRIIMFVAAIGFLIFTTSINGYIPNRKLRKWLNHHFMLMSCRIFSRAFSSVITFHDRENRATRSGICVANHTSPIDVMVLSCDNCYAMIGQKTPGFLGFLQKTLSKSEHHIWFERGEANDRKQVTERMRNHISDESKLPIIIFPEGTCINNTSVMMFKKGSFEIGSTIYPIAVKYDSRLTDAFWNSSVESYGHYIWSMMTSWAIICDVWYLPPMTREENEDAISFARRVKKAIAKKGGLVDLEWDGQLKREKVSTKLIKLYQDLYYERLARTTTLNNLMDSETVSNVLEYMSVISDEERNRLLLEIDEQDTDENMLRKISNIVGRTPEVSTSRDDNELILQ